MQNLTTISEKDIPIMISSYNLGKYINFMKFNNGACQTTLSILTSSGAYVLRYFENRTLKHVEFETKLINELINADFPVPKIFPNKNAGYYEVYKNKPYVITEFITGQHCSDPNVSIDKEALKAIIKTVADLHTLTNRYPAEYFSDRTVYDAQYCWGEFCKNHKRLINLEQGKWFKQELNNMQLSDTLPKGLCHADLNYSNFLFRAGKVVAMLDFDMSFYTYLIYDIASLIYWWAWSLKEGFNLKSAKQIASEYSKHRILSSDERKNIIPALKLIILLGIAWSKDSDIENEMQKIKQLNTENWQF